jgi:MATE family multidrug resistance protein
MAINSTSGHDDDGFADAKTDKVLGWTQSTIEVVKASVPTILSNIFFMLVQMQNIYFMGHYSSDSQLMASVGMGNMLTNVVCLATCLGFNGTIETFVSQSFGAGSKYMCGVQFNRGRIIITIVFIPLAILLFFSDTILIACLQDPTISTISRNYICWTLPGIFAYV